MTSDRPQWPHCPWCERHHAATHACEPVRQMLAAMVARGESLTMPTLSFPQEPIAPIPGLGEPGDKLLAQVVIQAAVVDVAGVPRAGLLFARLAYDMAGLAITTARSRR